MSSSTLNLSQIHLLIRSLLLKFRPAYWIISICISMSAETQASNGFTLTSPNGGETWQAGTKMNITWTWIGGYQLVKLYYSTNNGINWYSITPSTANDGLYSWYVPNIPSTQCLIRICDVYGPPCDESNASFTITLLASTRAAMVIRSGLQDTLGSYISQFIDDVHKFDSLYQIDVYWWEGTNHLELRAFLDSLHSATDIEGAWLIGDLPYATWKFQWGEVCELPYYYEDFDGNFVDSNFDGHFDHYYWGLDDGPEIWVSWLRPENYLVSYFEKCHSYYSGGLALPFRALICTTHDWDDTLILNQHLRPWYEDSVKTIGGGGQLVSGQPYLQALADGYSFITLYTHSSSTYHVFDIAPNQFVTTGDVSGRKGSYFEILFACHAADFIESPLDNFSIAYTFNSTHEMTILGATRSIGTERQEVLLGPLAANASVGSAYLSYLRVMYDSSLIYSRYPDEIDRFVWDFTLFGNPFLQLIPRVRIMNPSGGNIWPLGSTQTVQWASRGLTGTVRVELNRDFPSGTWEILSSGIPVSTSSWSWDSVTGSLTENARIKVASENYDIVVDTMSANFSIRLCQGIPGDANASNSLSLADMIAAVNYIFNKPGCSPLPLCWLSGLLCRGDWDASGTVTLGDVIRGVNYIFGKPGGPWNPVPSGACCLPVP